MFSAQRSFAGNPQEATCDVVGEGQEKQNAQPEHSNSCPYPHYLLLLVNEVHKERRHEQSLCNRNQKQVAASGISRIPGVVPERGNRDSREMQYPSVDAGLYRGREGALRGQWGRWKLLAGESAAWRIHGMSVGTPGVVAAFNLTKIIAGTVTDVDETVASTTPDIAFRWDGQQWVFNISTSNLPANKTYVYTITLNDGSTIIFQYGLR